MDGCPISLTMGLFLWFWKHNWYMFLLGKAKNVRDCPSGDDYLRFRALSITRTYRNTKFITMTIERSMHLMLHATWQITSEPDKLK